MLKRAKIFNRIVLEPEDFVNVENYSVMNAVHKAVKLLIHNELLRKEDVCLKVLWKTAKPEAAVVEVSYTEEEEEQVAVNVRDIK